MITVQHYTLLSIILFSIGAIGFLVRRNVIVALMSIELMLNAVNLALVAFNRQWMGSAPLPYLGGTPNPGDVHQTGQMFTFFIIAVAAAESAVGLAIVISLYRVRRTVRTDEADQLRG